MDTNVIYCGDNVEVLEKYVPDASVDLIYIDPPFNTSRQYEVFWGEAQERRAFEDRFGDAMTYLDCMRPRLREIYRVLKPNGTFYYHCDYKRPRVATSSAKHDHCSVHFRAPRQAHNHGINKIIHFAKLLLASLTEVI